MEVYSWWVKVLGSTYNHGYSWEITDTIAILVFVAVGASFYCIARFVWLVKIIFLMHISWSTLGARFIL